MSNVDSASRAGFFPHSRQTKVTNKKTELQRAALKRNGLDRIKELEASKTDAKVNIPDAIRDFSRIKKAVDASPEVDNSDKIAKLKSQINNGTYKVDYEALADKILASEF
ncbi:MAG: flagellar biosynthesis anti-sigma factor FlgM [Bacteriovoracaceae bacterium]|nr:flagellar biosynthesis anti-sigma factor FlgM [Bacteriovoracaceae bacterium]